MKEIYVFHHLGLGDHIICNALIRNICKKVQTVNLFVKPQYYVSVSFMFRDLKNLNLIQADDEKAHSIFKNIQLDQKLSIGTSSRVYSNMLFDEVFYTSIGLKFEKRWTDFYIERDLQREQELYKRLIQTDDYIFVHDDSSRMFNIHFSDTSNNSFIIRPQQAYTNNIFDYIGIIENAKEIHVMDSCFKHIVESIDVKTDELYYYVSVRGTGVDNMSTCRKKWTIR